jgi:hypothetical protein
MKCIKIKNRQRKTEGDEKKIGYSVKERKKI